jgi:hypothetical protein
VKLCEMCEKNPATSIDRFCRGCARVLVVLVTREASVPVDRRYR